MRGTQYQMSPSPIDQQFMFFVRELPILSVKMTKFRVLCADLLILNYTQYFTVSPCFRREFDHLLFTVIANFAAFRHFIQFTHLYASTSTVIFVSPHNQLRFDAPDIVNGLRRIMLLVIQGVH